MKAPVLACMLAQLAAASVSGAAPFLEGTVVDEQGRPIAGASVKIWDCIGTCLGGKTVLTDAQGRYVFEEKSFRNFPSLAVSMPGRYEVSRKQSGPALDKEDTEVPRRADFVLGTPAAATVRLEGDAPEGWTQTVKIRAGRDAQVHRYDVSADYVSGWDHWNFSLLPKRESLHLVVVREPIVEETDDPKESRERQRQSWRDRIEIVSPAIRLNDPQRYDVRAKVSEDSGSGTSYLLVESVTDALGSDRTAEFVDAGAHFGPPVDEEMRQTALDLLKRVQTAAVPWNGRPARELTYEYDAVYAERGAVHVTIDGDSPSGPAWSDIARLRGFAYMPPLRWLFSQPENVTFHGLDVDEERAVLQYRLKEPRGFGAGIGVGTSWHGFFTTRFSAGTITIDPATATVLEHRLSNGLLGDEMVETFADYVAVGSGYAPRSLRIQSGSQDFRLRLRIHRDRLWLLDKASHGDREASFSVENVVVRLND